MNKKKIKDSKERTPKLSQEREMAEKVKKGKAEETKPEKKRRRKWKTILLSVVCVFLTLILLGVIFVAIVLDRMLGKVDRVTGTEETLSSSELHELLNPTVTRPPEYTGPAWNSDEITMPTEPAEIIDTNNKINILLIGQDRRGKSGRSLSDAMILCTINKETKTLTMTSFLRDTYVQIPGHRQNKLNIAYPVGGMELLDATLELNFGVVVDGNVEVDFTQFATIIDLFGGVDINLTSAEASHLNNNYYGWWLKEGVNHLDGKQALAYSRIRYIGTDFGRTNRQRIVLTALLEQFRNASVDQLISAISGVLDLVTTDMTDQQIIGYAMELAPILKDLKIVSQSIPVKDTYYFGDVSDRNIVDCIFIDFEANRKVLKDTIGD